jgi:hypothetical protein
MSEKAILEALQKAVIAAVAASTLPATAVKYVGRNFTKPANGKWLEVVHIPNNITNEFWGDEKTYRGLFRLILHWPMVDKGAYEPLALIETISNYFAKGTKFADVANTVRVSITDRPNLLGIIEEPPEMLFPVSIQYQFLSA